MATERDYERELAELRELYDLDTQWLKAENAALADALRCRIESQCDECGDYIQDGFGHGETCRHFATEKKVMDDGAGYAPVDCWVCVCGTKVRGGITGICSHCGADWYYQRAKPNVSVSIPGGEPGIGSCIC